MPRLEAKELITQNIQTMKYRRDWTDYDMGLMDAMICFYTNY
jgi:hypothetical protein